MFIPKSWENIAPLRTSLGATTHEKTPWVRKNDIKCIKKQPKKHQPGIEPSFDQSFRNKFGNHSPVTTRVVMMFLVNYMCVWKWYDIIIYIHIHYHMCCILLRHRLYCIIYICVCVFYHIIYIDIYYIYILWNVYILYQICIYIYIQHIIYMCVYVLYIYIKYNVCIYIYIALNIPSADQMVLLLKTPCFHSGWVPLPLSCAKQLGGPHGRSLEVQS